MRAYQAKGGSRMNALNVDANQPQGDYVVVDKSEGVLKVYRATSSAKTTASWSRPSR